MRKILTAALMILACPVGAFANDKPSEIATIIRTDTPVGRAEMNKLVFHVYDASFWSDSGSNAKAPYALSIRYDMDFSKNDLIARTVKELKHVSTLPDNELQQFGAQLATIWPDISKGDRITAFTADAKQTIFYYNGKNVGQISSAQFTRAFFGIWLSPNSSEPEMRDALLGK